MRKPVRLLAILLAACGSAEPMAASNQGKAAAPPTLVLTDKAADKALAIGQVVEVRLPARLGTGYSWAIMSTPAEVELIESRTERAGESVDGGAETQIFRFRAVRRGTVTLRFDYRRPWMKDRPPERSLTQRLRIGR